MPKASVGDTLLLLLKKDGTEKVMGEESRKNRAAKKAVAVTAAASMLVSGLFSPPADLPKEEDLLEQPAVVEMLLPEPEPVETPVENPEEEKRKRRLSLPARIVVIAGIWIIAAAVIAVVASMLAALPAISAAILRFAATALVIALAAVGAMKLLFPEKTLSQLLSRENLLKTGAVCILSGLLCAAGASVLQEKPFLRAVLCPTLALVPPAVSVALSKHAGGKKDRKEP